MHKIGWGRVWVLALALCTTARAGEESIREFLFPLSPYLADTVGMVFPAAPVAADINAASLVFADRNSYLEFANAPSIDGSSDYALNASLAWTGKHFGIGGGYVGTVGTAATHGFFGGLGFSLGALSLGLSSRMHPGASLEVDASLVIPMQKKLRFATVLTDVLVQRKLNVGVGYQSETYYFEIDVRLPPLSDLTAGYSFTGALSFYMGKTTFYAAGGYATNGGTITYTVGLGRRLLSRASILTQYASTGRAGLAIVLPL